MITANIHQAKTHLSKLIERAEAGEDVVIARAGSPRVRLVPIHSAERPRPGAWLGSMRGEVAVSPDISDVDRKFAALMTEGD